MKISALDHTPRTLQPYIQEHVPLNDKNWFQTGGNARYFATPQTPLEFQQTITFAHEHQLPLCLLGQGANILISDEGFDGIIVKPALNGITHIPCDTTSVLVTAQTNVTMDALINYCLDNQILGLEEFSGIPGTIGGSVYINLHYFQFLLSQFLTSAVVLEKQHGTLLSVDNAWFNFGYNYSTLHNENHYLMEATFLLKRGSEHEISYARGRRAEIIRHRASRYPNKNTCGSFFRNFYDNEVELVQHGKKIIFVAYYLDSLGIKGKLRVGDAIISYQHANMIVNLGNATSSDIIALARKMQTLVLDAYGILPQPECRLIGFKEYPLLQ